MPNPLDVTCPRCGAAPRQRCRMNGFGRDAKTHVARMRLAEAPVPSG